MKRIAVFTAFAAFVVAGPQVQAQTKKPTDIDAEHAPLQREKDPPWTRERMEQSKPTPLMEVDPKLKDRLKPSTPRKPAEKTPGKASSEPARDVSIEDKRYTGNVLAMPMKWAGRLFYTKDGQDGWNCTAQFIRPNVILTAAHCVRDRDTGRFYSNFRFYQQYRDGSYGQQYSWGCVTTLNGWVNEEFPNYYYYDFAMLYINTQSATGHFGWHANYTGQFDRATSIGYPGAILQGRFIQVENGPIEEVDPALAASEGVGVMMLRHNNPNFTQGASGGAWSPNFTNNVSGNHAISVNSFFFTGAPQEMYGPYLGDPYINLLRYAQNRCRD